MIMANYLAGGNIVAWPQSTDYGSYSGTECTIRCPEQALSKTARGCRRNLQRVMLAPVSLAISVPNQRPRPPKQYQAECNKKCSCVFTATPSTGASKHERYSRHSAPTQAAWHAQTSTIDAKDTQGSRGGNEDKARGGLVTPPPKATQTPFHHTRTTRTMTETTTACRSFRPASYIQGERNNSNHTW